MSALAEQLTCVRGSWSPIPAAYEDEEVTLTADHFERLDDRIRTRLIAEGYIIYFVDKQNWEAIPPSLQEWEQ